MKVNAKNWQCNVCSTKFEYGDDPVKARCPTCGSPRLTRFIAVEDEINMMVAERLRLVGKKPALPSSRKRRREIRSGVRHEGNGSGKLVNEYRLSDADADIYEEEIIDVETGEIIRHTKESLSAHQNHGSARKRIKGTEGT